MNPCKIDFVIPWVDGSDPVWQEEKNRYLGEEMLLPDLQPDAGENRYRDWNSLKYWFRSVEAYAPWVNRVHFITWGHIPEWLNRDCEKLHIVKHADYIPKKYLPVFSSHPIELNMHRIPDLADQFVYFNDDMYLNAPVKPTDFFVHGRPCDSLAEQPLSFSGKTTYNSILINNMIFANTHFRRKEVRRKYRRKLYSLKNPEDSVKNFLLGFLRTPLFFGIDTHHLPQAYQKKTLQDVWQTDFELLDETCSHRFRSSADINQFVFKFWQLLSGNFEPYNKKHCGRALSAGRNTEEICQMIQKRGCKLLCINDSDVKDFTETQQKINAAFEKVFPEKSIYEK